MKTIIKTACLTALLVLSAGAFAQPQQRELSAADKVLQEQQKAFEASLSDIMPLLMELNKAYYESANRDSINALMEPLRKAYTERQRDYMEKNPSTSLTASFLRMEMGHMPLDKIKEAYAKLDETARQSTPGQEMAKEIATLERVMPGNPAPEIAKNDFVTDQPFSLSSLRGKVVLLDFWASWCKPCRASNPHVKALYEKYNEKGFDVVYVADNDSRPEDALKAIDEDGIRQYHHVLRGLKQKTTADGQFAGYDNSDDVSHLYAVHFLPTKYLIDREGNIIGKVDDETLDQKLREIFGAQGIETRVSGHLEGMGDSLMVDVIDMNLEETHSRNVYPMNDGNFAFTVLPEHVSTLILRGKPSSTPGQMMSMKVVQVTLMPGEDVVVNGNIDDYTVSGTPFYDECQQVQALTNTFYRDLSRDNYEAKMKELRTAATDYIKAHPTQEAAMTLIGAFQTASEMKAALQLFDPSVREGRMQWYYKPLLQNLEQRELREQNAGKIVEGAVAPDFTLPQLDGTPLSLSSLRGKYVVLDFWGSWCHWCIKGFPDMKKYYAKYKDQLEILGIDCNDTEEKWKAAVKEHKPTWRHVRQSKETTNVSNLYGISGYPTKIVIDPEGRIAKVVVGESPEFYEFLDEAFGKKLKSKKIKK